MYHEICSGYIYGFCCSLLSHGCGFETRAFLDLESLLLFELRVSEVGKVDFESM